MYNSPRKIKVFTSSGTLLLLAFSLSGSTVFAAGGNLKPQEVSKVPAASIPATSVPSVKPTAIVPTATAPAVSYSKVPMAGTNGPLRYGPVNPEAADPNAAAADDSSGQGGGSQMMQQLMQGLTGGGLGADSAIKSTTGSGSGASSSAGGSKYVSRGEMDKCPADGSIPPSVDAARKEAMDFRTKCGAANRGDKQKVVINDYSCDGTPTMWIFDTAGNCIAKTAISYGNGVNGEGASKACPQGCADGGEHLTPPGFHLTGDHPNSAESKYNSSNSMEMIGLEGQKSSGSSRGILIHKAASQGGPSSWGCSGVCYDCFDKVKSLLGFGALVYNYFGATPAPSTCSNHAGMNHGTSCQLDRSAPEINPLSTPQATTLQDNFMPSSRGGGSNGGGGSSGSSGSRR